MRTTELVVSVALLVVLVAVAVGAEISIRRQRAAGHDPISPAMHRWGGHHQLWSAAGAALLGAALVSPLGADFGRFAWVGGLVVLLLAVALVFSGLRELRRARG